MEGLKKKPFKVTDELLANHRQRVANWLVDLIVQVIIMFIVLVFMSAISIANGNKEFMLNFVKNDIAQYTLAVVVQLFYFNVFEIFFARTVGKFITQTVVVDENGEKPHYENIMIRSLSRLIPFEVLSFIGTPPRGWHDSLSKTYVVNKRLLDEQKHKFNQI